MFGPKPEVPDPVEEEIAALEAEADAYQDRLAGRPVPPAG